MKPAITVFIPYYNDENFIEKSIHSVLNSKFKDFELILLNHNSSDRSRSIAHSFSDSRIVHIDLEVNYSAGGGILFERALSCARGKYFKPFCADDLMSPECLGNLYEYMESQPSIDFAFAGVKHINSQGKIIHIPKFKNLSSMEALRELVNERNFLCYPAAIIKTNLLKKTIIDNSYILLFDLSLWVSMLVANHNIGFLENTYIYYRIHEGQISKSSPDIARLYEMEIKSFWRLFLNINNLETVKYLWPTSTLVSQLRDSKDIPFVVSRELLVSRRFQGNSFVYIHDLLMNSQNAVLLKEKFGYDIKSFRNDMLSFTICCRGKDFKHYVYNTPSKYLDFKSLTYLLFRRLLMKIKCGLK